MVIRQFSLLLISVFWVTFAYAGSSDSDFREIKLGAKFDPIKQGYEQLEDITGAPGVRIKHFEKFYQGGFVANAVGIYRGLAILKLQNALQDNKAECQQNIVRMVVNAGVKVRQWPE